MPTTATTAKKAEKTPRKRAAAKTEIALPASSSTVIIGDREYVVTPKADMAEWLEDLEDIVDSLEALNDPKPPLPWEEVKRSLGLGGAEAKRGAGRTGKRK